MLYSIYDHMFNEMITYYQDVIIALILFILIILQPYLLKMLYRILLSYLTISHLYRNELLGYYRY